MDRSVHIKLLEKLTIPVSASPHFHAIATLFNVSFDTVYSIYSQEVQARVIKAHHLLKTAIPELTQRYLAGEELISICFEVDVPPCIVLRRLLEALSLPKNKITEILRDPTILPNLIPLEHATQALATVPSPRCHPSEFVAQLQKDVELCISCDRVYSPASDTARHSAGLEYEAKLYNGLDALGIAFWTEESLRSKGFHKTPDARLQVPVAINGNIVCWIDSKATFGDEKMHRQQMKEQYQRYVNRFGPGLVVYWHGYIADLQEESEGVLLLDRLPRAEELTMLPQLSLDDDDDFLEGSSLEGERLKKELDIPSNGECTQGVVEKIGGLDEERKKKGSLVEL